ncbi:hydrogenase nickel incorporation protein HypA [Thermogladius sp. KZ2Tp1]|uniref:hydrogenase nickel incorporation protein HypA n=1 Tax=Thermogladius sp. KZ2Tp1 TaxID=3136289 RepID=UPI003DA95206
MVHEWSLAEALLRYVASVYGPRIKSLKLRVGVLQSIDKEVLLFSIRELAGLYNVSLGDVVLEDEEAVFKCNRCGYEWSFNPGDLGQEVRESIHFLPEAVFAYTRCPRCGSRDFKVVKGRGLEVAEVVPG